MFNVNIIQFSVHYTNVYIIYYMFLSTKQVGRLYLEYSQIKLRNSFK